MVRVCTLVMLVVAACAARSFDMSQCIAPLGMESGLIPDKDISASSCYNDGNVAPQNARLNRDIKGGAWCPLSQITTESREWLEVQLPGVHVVTAVGTQGRFGNGQGQEYAEGYVLEYWRPRLGKWLRYRAPDGREILEGNKNTYLEKKNRLQPVWASRVRFLPHSAHRRTVCMRVEVYGCLWTAGVVSYSAPAGDTLGGALRLAPAAYDGEWVAGELRGGLGLLVDGAVGSDDLGAGWLGWWNRSRGAPLRLLFEFDRVREFSAVHIYVSNKFTKEVQVFSEAVVWFSVSGRQWQEGPARLRPPRDRIFESGRNVTLPLHHRIARWVRIDLYFAASWILVSEVVFDSDVAQGNFTAEKPPAKGRAGAGAGAAGGGGGAGGGAVSTARGEDAMFVAVAVGVMTALVILVGVAAALLLHRHRHRKCFASPHLHHKRNADTYSACGTASVSEKGAEAKCGEYQEPLAAPYRSVLLEMGRLPPAAEREPDDCSNYDYAVPELSSAPLLERARPRAPPPPPSPPPAAPHNDDTLRIGSLDSDASWRSGAERGLERGVALLPTHRLRMIAKLAEGSFGTLEPVWRQVYVAEADGVADYDGATDGDSDGDTALVAVKFLAADASDADRELFLREAAVMSRLSHAALSRVLGVCRGDGGAPGLVLEYPREGSLHARLRRGPAPAPAALLRLAVQLAAALRYLAALGLAHRDVAARNCLVSPGGRLKLGDLGAACEAYAPHYVRGVPLRWAAWEAALHGAHSPAADAWAFAVTVHEMFTLCRHLPYRRLHDDQLWERLAALGRGAPGFVPLQRAAACPRRLHELLRRCWRREPAARPSAADALLLIQTMMEESSSRE